MLAFDAGYAWPADNVRDCFYRFNPPTRTSGRPQVTLDGNSAMTYGLIAAGVRYGSGYPITPWSSIMEMLRAELPKYGGLFVQARMSSVRFPTALGFSYSATSPSPAAPVPVSR
jgi:2-oxoglutarate ferredoxin oxidoreductase subunit alpha